jgi:hypothetical protein
MVEVSSRVAAAASGARPGRPQYPALAAWRAELSTGARTTYTFDPLWSAACAEMSALEFDADGLLGLAASCQRDAQRIVRAAARRG